MLKGVSESFKNRADSAAFWEAWVAAVLTRSGLCVACLPFEIDGKDHSDSYDLWVSNHDPQSYNFENGLEVEVKSVNLSFGGPQDYPFHDVLVCSESSFLKKWPGGDHTERDFLFVSRITGSVVWIPAWTLVELNHPVHDKTRNEVYKAAKTVKPNLRSLGEFVEHVRAQK